MKTCAYCGQPEELFIHPLTTSPRPPYLVYNEQCKEKAFEGFDKKPLTASEIWGIPTKGEK